MKKIIRIGWVKGEGDIFCKIEVADGKLSISGVIGPMRGGNARGSSGQICMSFKECDKRGHLTLGDVDFAPGWNKKLADEFLAVWDRWHLNDMKANCGHQTGPEWDAGRELTLYCFRLARAAEEAIEEAEKRASSCIKAGGVFTPTVEETRLANLPDRLVLDSPTLPGGYAADYVPNTPRYAGDIWNKPSEVKLAGWTHPQEHPGGLLCKPCPVCGYEYGSEWRKEELPAEVVSFLRSLPDTDKTPAWI